MQTTLYFITAILTSAAGGFIGAFIGLAILHEVRCYRIRKNVLKAIKDLNIEDELAKCPVGVDAKLFNAIKTYLREHNMRDPFVEQGSAFAMTLLIADLRKKGEIKPLEIDRKFDELVKENPFGAFKNTEETPSETPIAFSVSAFYRWLAKWGFKKNINMLQLMQYRVDEYQGDLGLLLKESVYARIPAKEYLVTIHGEYVLVDANTLAKMEADFYAENVSPNSHLIAIPKDWVDEMVNKHPELILTDVE